MICTVHQPNYLPYLGFFEKALQSDVFIIYDTTQFRKNDWQNRNRLCSPDGWQWITISVFHNFEQKIKEVKIDHSKKPLKNNWSKIQTLYGKAPHFKQYAEIFEYIYKKDYLFIADLNYDLIIAIGKVLGLKTKFIKSSSLPTIETKSTQALIDLCNSVKADTYISGSEGRNYLEQDLFAKSGIILKFQNYEHPVYKQFNNSKFQPYMSAIDLIFNYGEESLCILDGNRH
jgi:hypothetical protein